MAAEDMSVNRDGDSRAAAMFWSWKGGGTNGENKRKWEQRHFQGGRGILAMSCDCQEAKNLLNLPGSGYTEWEKCERIGAGSKEAVISR